MQDKDIKKSKLDIINLFLSLSLVRKKVSANATLRASYMESV